MPLYDLQCILCGEIQEVYFPKITEFLEFEDLTEDELKELDKTKRDLRPGYELIYCADTRFRNQVCKCAGFQELVTPLTNMQPDNMWSGVNTQQGYFTSKSEYQKVLKQRGLESVTMRELEGIRKNVKKTKQAKFDKQLNNLTKHIQKELAGVEVSPDGNTVKDKRKYVKSRD